MRSPSRPLLFLVAAMIAFFTTRAALVMLGLEGWYTRPPLWDQASHALDAIHFSQAFRTLDLQKFLVQLNNSALWPPVIPLLQAPFLMIFGEDYGVVRSWMAWCSIFAALMVLLVGWQSHRRFGLIVGALAAALLAVSPGYLEFCLQEMYEVPGIFLCMVTLFCYVTYLQTQNRRAWLFTCLTGSVLFFSKFNYAILIMLPILVCEICYQTAFRRLVIQAALRLQRDIRWRGPFTIFIACYVVFLVYVQKIGIHFELFGQRVMIERALGNPTYFLFALVLIRNLLVNRELVKTYVRNLWQADEPVRSLLRCNVLPALIWLSYPTFFSTFFIFLFSEKTRQQSFFSLETLTFYPGSVLHLFTPSPVLGGLVLASLGVLLIAWRRLPLVTRFLLGLTLFNLALTISHPNYQTRYLLTSVPLMFLLLGLAVAHSIEGLMARQGTRRDGWWLALAPLLTLGILLGFAPKREFLQASLTFNTHDPRIIPVYEAICQDSTAVKTNTLVGFSGTTAPATIALICYKMFPDMPRATMPTTMIRHGFHGETSAAAILASRKIEQYFVVDYSRYGIDVGRLQEPDLVAQMKELLPHTASYEEHVVIDQGEGGLKITGYRLRKDEAARASAR